MPEAVARLLERRSVQVWLLASVIGSLTFFAWMGYARTLDPTSLDWIFHEDPFTHVMGWEQFRNAPLLQYPITSNHLYGLEWSSNIVFTDSIPAVGILLRPIAAVLPVPFQYLGFWVLLSLVLQAYFGARLMLLRSPRLRDAAIGAVFFVTTPVLLERLGLQTAVGSHWLLLWALWLYAGKRTVAHRSWLVLLVLTVTVHAYLFVMVGAIWAAHLARCWVQRVLTRRDLALVGASLLVVVATMHVLGYFSIGGGAAGSGWRSNFDLLGFIAPCAGARLGIMPSVYDDPWDGSTYLGAGVMLLLVATAITWAVRRRNLEPSPAVARIPWWPLVAAVVGMLVFAITNHVTAANDTLAILPLPRMLRGVYETFRGANRMAWPAYYLILTSGLWFAFRAWPARLVSTILGVALAIQLVDLSGHAAIKHNEMDHGGIARPLRDPIWNAIPAHYQQIVSVPAKHRQLDWPAFAWFAARHKMGSNIGYVSRNDRARRLEGAARNLDAVVHGAYDRRTVYYFPSDILWTVARQTMGPDDVALIADGFRVILPGARAWASSNVPAVTAAVPRLGEKIDFTTEESEGLLIDGWSWRDSWGTWSIGPHSWLVLPVPVNDRVRVTLEWAGLMKNKKPQALHMTIDGRPFEVRFRPSSVSQRHSFEVTTVRPLIDIQIDMAQTLDVPNDRDIGIGIVFARVQHATDVPVDTIPAAASSTPILDTPIKFAKDMPGRDFLVYGWSWGEAWGTWSADAEPELALPVPAGQRMELTLEWLATAPPGKVQALVVWIDEHAFDVTFAPGSEKQTNSFRFTSTRPYVTIRINVKTPVDAKDGRTLGVGLISAQLSPVP